MWRKLGDEKGAGLNCDYQSPRQTRPSRTTESTEQPFGTEWRPRIEPRVFRAGFHLVVASSWLQMYCLVVYTVTSAAYPFSPPGIP